MTNAMNEKMPDFEKLIGRIQATSEALTARAWLTGYYIVEYEQHGEDRAKYGEQLLKRLAVRLGSDKFAAPTLKTYRLFYKLYPSLVGEIRHYLESRFGKGSTVSSQLTGITTNALPEKGSTVSSLSVEQGLLVYFGDDVDISPSAIFNRLSYSHICELLHLPEPMMRTFYAFEAIRGTWSVRALRRQIDSEYPVFVKAGGIVPLSCDGGNGTENPHKLAALAQGRAEKLDAKDFVKQNTVLEFLGLKPQGDWDESDLERGILDNLKTFIRELGAGFCFEDQQQNILIDDVYERIDLVFYHRILKCHVLIELKPKKLNYKDVAQLSLYMSYYRKNKMTSGDNPPIGILLCTGIGHETAEYLAPFTDPKLFLSEYQLQLPAKEQFTEFLKKENKGISQ